MEVSARRQKEAERSQEQTQTQADVQAAHQDKGNAEKHDKAAKDASAKTPETDPLKVFSALKSERMAVQGGNFGHPHTPGACGFCSGAAARYA
jgi:hypothetical protein